MTRLTGRPLNWAITLTSGAGFMLFGYDQGVMSGLLTSRAFTATFPEIDTTGSGKGSPSLQGTVVAIYDIGCFSGAITSLFIGEWMGRRRSVLAGSVIMIIGAALQASSFSIPQLIVGRIVAGIGNGLNTSAIPVWHSELMKANKRGQGLCIELAINLFGVMSAYWIDYGMSYVDSSAAFRFPLAFQIVFALLTILGILCLPESPRWLVAHDRFDEARHVLWSVERDAHQITEDDPRISDELDEIKRAVDEERKAAGNAGFKAILKNGRQRFFYRTMLGIGGQFMQQISGINLITYYAPFIFQESVGLKRHLSGLLSGFLGIAFWASSLIPIFIIDKVGRRILMLFAVTGQCVCMTILAGMVAYSQVKACGIVAVICLFMFDIFFGIGLLAIPWLLPPEYAPLAIRQKASALATASNWIFTFLVVEITPVSISSIGWKTYIYFAVFNFCFIPLTYFFYPETKNLSLEKIDKLFTGEKVAMRWQPWMEEDESVQHPRLHEIEKETDPEMLRERTDHS